jgi:hypothetical protein
MVSDRTRAAWLQGCADVAQLVEHHLAKVRVAGSNPVVRSERVSPSPCGEQVPRWSGREARQRTANPCTRVQIPSPPRAIGAVGARFPDTEEVTGSNPVSPTSITPGQSHISGSQTVPRRRSRDPCLPNCLPKPRTAHAERARPSRSHRGSAPVAAPCGTPPR